MYTGECCVPVDLCSYFDICDVYSKKVYLTKLLPRAKYFINAPFASYDNLGSNFF